MRIMPMGAMMSLEKPHLFDGEQQAFERLLAGCTRYLEFGIGGTTLLAIRTARMVVSIDSDATWVRSASDHPEISAAVKRGNAIIRHADIGPVGDWGAPIGQDHKAKWPNYIATAWETWNELEAMPDVVFVDGRFRVACCLSAVLAVSYDHCLSRAIRIAMHDTGPLRPGYDSVLKFLEIVGGVNTLRFMKIRPDVSASHVMAALLRAQYDLY
jgi:hypothetical protein